MTASGRAYSSPLRAEHAAQTRDRIVDAAVALLQDGEVGAIGMQEVADEAGVSVRTVYRAFPTKGDLLHGVLEVISERFGRAAGAPPVTKRELHASIPGAVQAVYELEPLYRVLFNTAAGREMHRATARERSASVDQAVGEGLAHLDERQRRRFVSLMYLVTSSRAVLWLKDYADLDVDDAAGAVAWAVAAFDAALRDPKLVSEL